MSGTSEKALSRAETVRALFPALEPITDAELREAVVEIWVEAWTASDWEDLRDVPKGVWADSEGVGPLMNHVISVTDGVLAYADVLERRHGIESDRDLLRAAALLHDVSKVVEFAPGENGRPVVSELGRMLQHGVWTARHVLARGLPLDLAHLIVTHTPMSRTTPLNVEGLILYYVDSLDSDVLALHAGLPLWIAK